VPGPLLAQLVAVRRTITRSQALQSTLLCSMWT